MPQIKHDLETLGALIGDSTRACVLSALLTGQYLPAGELARRAKVSPQTMSSHLAKLVEGGLIIGVASGRHRYYALKNAEVAHVLEVFSSIVSTPTKTRTLRESLEIKALKRARTCYDHLAGQLGVKVTQAIIDKGWFVQHDNVFEISETGKVWLVNFGLPIETLLPCKRDFARVCIDWSERQPHISGAIGRALAQCFFERRWIERIPHSRALRITETGVEKINIEFQIPNMLPLSSEIHA